ncbi:MAG: hypothetical protein OXI15_14155 [Chromatiales bacterium]|nr:hypothetical protein [Chromatiales bacterium]
MNRIIEKRVASQSMTKWIGVFEEEFDLEAEGSTPTERMKDLIEQLRQLSDGGDSLEEIGRFVQRTVLTWYRKGARRGAAELVNSFMRTESWTTTSMMNCPRRSNGLKASGTMDLMGRNIKFHQRDTLSNSEECAG